MTAPEADPLVDGLAAIAGSARMLADQLSTAFLPAFEAARGIAAGIRERLEADAETHRRRARMAEWEASDPVGRLAEMRARHDAEARQLAARYGFPWPPERPRVAAGELPSSGLAFDFFTIELNPADPR